MQIKFWASTDVGRVREHNEDNFLVDKRLKLFVVCDGMGGHAAGEVASAIGVRSVRDTISAHRDVLERLNHNPNDIPTRREVLQLIERAIHDANAQVYGAAMEDESRRGMGTTCSLLLLTEGRGFIAHVGDSRIYLLREGQVHQMTEDHSLYNEMVRLGKIKPGEQVNLPNKNAVTRAVGVRDYVEVDVREFDTAPGDRFLTCSDGLSGYFKSDDQIMEMVQVGDVRGVTERCIEFAVDAGGRDNITAIVIEIEREVLEDVDAELMAEVITQTPYFQYLSAKELQEVQKLLQKRECAAGTELFNASEQGTDLYIVLHGAVRQERNGETFRLLSQGEYLGEVSFIDAQPNDFRAVTDDPSTLLVLERKRFMKLLRDKPALAVKLLWNFLQMFSIKLRQVPAEIVFTPMLDELDDVLVDADPTPAPGELVIQETLTARPSPPPTPPLVPSTPPPAASSSGPATPPMPVGASEPVEEPARVIIGEAPTGLSEPTAPHIEEPEEDLRQTVEFSRMEPDHDTSPLLTPPNLAPRPARKTTPAPLGRGISGESFSGGATTPSVGGASAVGFGSEEETGSFEAIELPPASEVSEARRDAPRAAMIRNRKKRRLGSDSEVSEVSEASVTTGRERDEELVSTVQLSAEDIQNHMVKGRSTVTQPMEREVIEEQVREDSSASLSVQINFDD